MAKKRNELRLDGKPAFYTILFPKMKEVAADMGYTLTVHGSMASDMDLLAVAWVEEAKPHQELVKALSKLTEPTIWKEWHFKEIEEKPHGRIVYTLSIYSDWFIDLSIIAPRKKLSMSSFRRWENQVARGEISLSKMIENINNHIT